MSGHCERQGGGMELRAECLSCTANVEWKDKQGTVVRRFAEKAATVRVLRDAARHLLVEVSAAKAAAIRLQLRAFRVHNKFMSEGKASIVFHEDNCALYVSNAPPGALLHFLRVLFVKTAAETTGSSVPATGKPPGYDEVSPMTTADLEHARRQASRATDTTPSPGSRKRSRPRAVDASSRLAMPPAKRLLLKAPVPLAGLDAEQQRVLDACLAGHNVFFTGSAGTGKSHLLRRIVAALPPAVTAATASTGVAACHIGGTTLHAFAGIGTGDAPLDKCCARATKCGAAQLWRRTKHLIIDEISMLDGHFFTKLEAVARQLRNNDKPFGGIQLVLCGDFLQLPPVSRRGDNDALFCFESPAWARCVALSFELTQVHRQSDATFIDILNEVREGRASARVVTALQATARQQIEAHGVLATRLSSQNVDADAINQAKLAALDGAERHFDAQDSDAQCARQLDAQTPVPRRLALKVGAQVMLVRNVHVGAGLVNGARGVVVRFDGDVPVVRFRNGLEHSVRPERWRVPGARGTSLSRLQLPLKLAWAFSIHKAQGLTLDCVEMSLARVFEPGQAYVALSRAQSLRALRVLDFDARQVWANPRVLLFYKRLQRAC